MSRIYTLSTIPYKVPLGFLNADYLPYVLLYLHGKMIVEYSIREKHIYSICLTIQQPNEKILSIYKKRINNTDISQILFENTLILSGIMSYFNKYLVIANCTIQSNPHYRKKSRYSNL